MIFALTTAPLFSILFEWIVKQFNNDSTIIAIGSLEYNLPGARMAILFGGLVAVAAGFLCRAQVVHPDHEIVNKDSSHPEHIEESQDSLLEPQNNESSKADR